MNTNKNNLSLDASLQSAEERTELVKRIIESASPSQLTPRYLEILANYILFNKKDKNKNIITDNQQPTIKKREISFQGLSQSLENGEDGIYNLIANDKNILFMPKRKITPKDLKQIPELRQLNEAIKVVEQDFKKASGKRKFKLKQQLIQMYQDQYVIFAHYHPPCYATNLTKSINSLTFNDCITVDADGRIKDDSLISFFNPKHISALLCHYSKLKECAYGMFHCDSWYLMESLDQLVDDALAALPLYKDLVIFKIDKKTNAEIQKLIKEEFEVEYSIEYLSSLWRNKIPKIIAEYAEKKYLEWYYTFKEKGQWKKCSRCGEIKLAHSKYFSKNKTSKDGYYSICKDCRNKKPVIIERKKDLR